MVVWFEGVCYHHGPHCGYFSFRLGHEDFVSLIGCASPGRLRGSHTSVVLGETASTVVDGISFGSAAVPPLNMRRCVWGGTADGAAAQQRAFDYLGDGFCTWILWCICHVLHLAVKDALGRVVPVQKIIVKAPRRGQ